MQDYQAIQRNADAFTIPAIENPVVRESMIQGHRYKILEWPLLMTPIQSGEHRLHFHTVVQVALPENPHQRGASPFPRSPFGGSFFNRIFRETETIELETPIHKMQVQALPQSGQPQGFSGAIGQFNCELSIDQKNVGRMIQLRSHCASVVQEISLGFKRPSSLKVMHGAVTRQTQVWNFLQPVH